MNWVPNPFESYYVKRLSDGTMFVVYLRRAT